jgi:pimeloyl-ACP methyl ester carboxylesterase
MKRKAIDAENPGMGRRQFVGLTAAALATGVVSACAAARRGPAGADSSPLTDAAAFHAARRFTDTPFGKIAHLDRGSGPLCAMFLHGAPLNSFQWRGAIDRLSADRRCIAADFLGLGYSQVPEHQSVAPDAQVAMLVALLDALAISQVDVIGNDSGGAVAQLLTVRHPGRVRSLLLTNCDVEPDSPPPKVMPAIEAARAGTLADQLAQWLADKPLARSQFGAAVYSDARDLTDEMIECYFAPNVSSPLRKAQFHGYHAALAPNPLAGVESMLARCTVPTRIVWGTGDDIFSQASPEYLARTLPQSRGIRRVPGAKLFFPEEYPEIIAEEARRLWREPVSEPTPRAARG